MREPVSGARAGEREQDEPRRFATAVGLLSNDFGATAYVGADRTGGRGWTRQGALAPVTVMASGAGNDRSAAAQGRLSVAQRSPRSAPRRRNMTPEPAFSGLWAGRLEFCE